MVAQTIDARLDPQNFCYWLQGFCEINGGTPTPEQWAVIKEHLELVFSRVNVPLPTQTIPNTFMPDWNGLESAGKFPQPIAIC